VNGLITLVSLPDKEIQHGELSVKNYKTFLKVLLNVDDTTSLLLNLNNILIEITNYTLEQLLNLNIIEYFLLLLSIRSTSIGGIIFATYNGEKKINLQIPLNECIEELNLFLDSYQPTTFNVKNVNVALCLPKIRDFITNKETVFIESIKVDGNNFLDIESLPVKVYKQINKNINYLKQDIDNLCFFNSVVENYSINFSSKLKEYISLIRILFNENLTYVYDNIFYLSKISNISAEYLENCTYGEFKFFVKKTESLHKSTPSTNNLPIEEDFEQVDINSLYGNDIQVSPSEFTP
jgi:hypothetical protein